MFWKCYKCYPLPFLKMCTEDRQILIMMILQQYQYHFLAGFTHYGRYNNIVMIFLWEYIWSGIRSDLNEFAMLFPSSLSVFDKTPLSQGQLTNVKDGMLDISKLLVGWIRTDVFNTDYSEVHLNNNPNAQNRIGNLDIGNLALTVSTSWTSNSSSLEWNQQGMFTKATNYIIFVFQLYFNLKWK